MNALSVVITTLVAVMVIGIAVIAVQEARAMKRYNQATKKASKKNVRRKR